MKEKYVSPQVEILEVEIESGFACSGTGSDPNGVIPDMPVESLSNGLW